MTDPKPPPPIPETVVPYLLSDRNALRFRNGIVELIKHGYAQVNLRIGEWSFDITFNREDFGKVQSLIIAVLEKGLQIAHHMEHDEEEYQSGKGPNTGYG